MLKLVLVLLTLGAIFAQAPICTSDATCNNFGTFQQQRCEIPVDPLAAVCQARNTFGYRTTTVDPKGMCKESLNFGALGTQICGGYGVAGCSVPVADINYVNCFSGTTRNILTEKCETNNASTTVYKGQGERCNLALSANPRTDCGNNLICVNNVCRPKLKLFDNCHSSPYGCGRGLVCDRQICRLAYTGVAQDQCSSNDYCLSGICLNGVCAERRSIPCWNNADCTGSADGVCYIKPGLTQGFCTNSASIAQFRYSLCTWASCGDIKSTLDACTACEKPYVDWVCATQCPNRPDLRKQNDGYIYNCATSTRTLATGCDNKATVLNCDTLPLSGAFTQALSFVVVLVVALVTLA